jgi:hypothetical protein
MYRSNRLAVVLLITSAAVAAYGQAVTANLQGVTTDPSGAVMADVAIKAVNLDTGGQRTTQPTRRASTLQPSAARQV